MSKSLAAITDFSELLILLYTAAIVDLSRSPYFHLVSLPSLILVKHFKIILTFSILSLSKLNFSYILVQPVIPSKLG